MKKSLLIALVLGLIAVPTLSMAGESEGQYVLVASNQLGDQELAVTSGHRWDPHAVVTEQGERQAATNGDENTNIISKSQFKSDNKNNSGFSGGYGVDNAIMNNVMPRAANTSR